MSKSKAGRVAEAALDELRALFADQDFDWDEYRAALESLVRRLLRERRLPSDPPAGGAAVPPAEWMRDEIADIQGDAPGVDLLTVCGLLRERMIRALPPPEDDDHGVDGGCVGSPCLPDPDQCSFVENEDSQWLVEGHHAGWTRDPLKATRYCWLGATRKAQIVSKILVPCKATAHAFMPPPEDAEQRARDLCEMGWTLIANAFGGDWDQASEEWRMAAEKWGDDYHALRHAEATQEDAVQRAREAFTEAAADERAAKASIDRINERAQKPGVREMQARHRLYEIKVREADEAYDALLTTQREGGSDA